MCLYSSICGLLLHMWWPSLDLAKAAAWDSRNPLQFANELSVKERARAPAAQICHCSCRCSLSGCRHCQAAIVFKADSGPACLLARARSQFLWWACFMPPKGKKQQQGNNPSSSQMSNGRFNDAALQAHAAVTAQHR